MDAGRGRGAEPEMCRLHDIVRAACAEFAGTAEAQAVAIDTQVADEIELPLERARMERVFLNLIDNALKYGMGGSSRIIDLSARQVGETIEICVADHGAGISTLDRERVTGRFVRLENSRSRPGSGLGLSMVAAIARLHHGELKLEDNAPGLRVILSLPLLQERPSLEMRD